MCYNDCWSSSSASQGQARAHARFVAVPHLQDEVLKQFTAQHHAPEGVNFEEHCHRGVSKRMESEPRTQTVYKRCVPPKMRVHEK